MDSKFYLPKQYRENPPLTFSEHPRDYWTPERISTSHEFQYHVYEYAGEMFKKIGGKSLLDIGAGPGTKLPFFFDLENTDLSLIDQPGMDEITKDTCPNADFFGANLETDPVDTNKQYDMIICSDVIEHLNNPENLLNIIKRHLKKDGIAIVSTPDRTMRREKGNMQSPNKAHVREWSSKELKQYLLAEKFKVIRQRNLPLKRLSPFKLFLSQNLFYQRMKKEYWFACQMIILQ